MGAGKYKLEINRGETLFKQMVLKDIPGPSGVVIDLTGWTFRGKIRKTFADANALVDFTFETNAPATDGVLRFKLTAAQTEVLAASEVNASQREIEGFFYDIEGVKPDGVTVIRILEGECVLSQEATR